MPVYRPKPSVVATEVQGEAVLLDLDSRSYFSLNETGTLIWTLLGEGREPAAIADALTTEFEIDHDQAGPVVAAFVADLVAEGLITPEA